MPKKPQDPVQEGWNHQDYLHGLRERIHDLRKSHGMTQQELAQRIGVSFQCISYAERGDREPRSSNLLKIADVLQVSTDYLMKGKVPSEEYVVVINGKMKKLKLSQLQFLARLIYEIAEE